MSTPDRIDRLAELASLLKKDFTSRNYGGAQATIKVMRAHINFVEELTSELLRLQPQPEPEAKPAPPKTKRSNRVPAGTYGAHYIPLLKSVKPGGFVEVPIPDGMNINFFQRAITGWASSNWGADSYQTQQRPQERTIYVVRR